MSANPPLIRLAKFTRDLLSVDEQLVRVGRLNFERDDFDDTLIAIDSIGPATRLASSQSFDGAAELMSYSDTHSLPVTINFFGDTAYTLSAAFRLSLRSQPSIELQRLYEVTVFQPSTVTDLKHLAGSGYTDRVELTLNIHVVDTIDIDTLRIDTPQFEIQNEQGQVL